MSHKERLNPEIIGGNTISIANQSKTIDFSLQIKELDYNGLMTGTAIPLRAGFNDHVFVALFDDRDTNFGFHVYNRSDTKNVSIKLTYGKTYSFIIIKGQNNAIQTLESCGQYLRFLTPNRPIGHSLAKLYPSGRSDSQSDAQVMCSRMKIGLQIDKNQKSGVASKSVPIVAKPLPKTGVFVKEEENVFTVSSLSKEVGKRGVIGFGHKSDTPFPYYYGFIADEDYNMEPFFIEFRLKNNYLSFADSCSSFP